MTRCPLFTTFFSRYGFLLGLITFSANYAKAQPVRGLYVSGAGGASFNQTQTVNPHTKNFSLGRDEFSTGITGIGSIGWGLDNGFRVELEGNYRNNRYSGFHEASFPSHTSGHQQAYGAMANALFDMDIGQNWIYPYFGAGLGYGRQHMNTNLLQLRDNSIYAQHVGGTSSNFAYQAMFGVSLPVPWVVGLSTTMEYRFYSILGHHRHNSESINFIDSPLTSEGRRGTRTDFNHSLMLGLRYEFNPAPPPPSIHETPITAPAPTSTRTYLVFFDWDSSNLSNKTRLIISEAAKSVNSAQITHIEVNGHTDMSGESTKAGRNYNQALSLKRAHAVESELIRDGIAAGLIHIHAFGASQPLITTAMGVKEPQNRRVEIDLK